MSQQVVPPPHPHANFRDYRNQQCSYVNNTTPVGFLQGFVANFEKIEFLVIKNPVFGKPIFMPREKMGKTHSVVSFHLRFHEID